MNFKTILFLCPFIIGCGVKGDPRPPGDTMLPSVEAYYLEDLNKPQKEEEEKKEEIEKTSSKESKKNEKDKTTSP